MCGHFLVHFIPELLQKKLQLTWYFKGRYILMGFTGNLRIMGMTQFLQL